MKQLTEYIFIECDDYQYILYDKKTRQSGKNKGEEYYDLIGYYSNVEQVSNQLNNLGVKKWINGEFSDCVDFVTRVHNEFLEEIKKLRTK